MKTLISKFNIWEIFSILMMLNVWDAATTAILVAKFGADVEANPIMHHAITYYGISGLYMMKFMVVGFLGLMLAAYVRRQPEVTTIQHFLWVPNIVLATIVYNNIILVVNTINI